MNQHKYNQNMCIIDFNIFSIWLILSSFLLASCTEKKESREETAVSILTKKNKEELIDFATPYNAVYELNLKKSIPLTIDFERVLIRKDDRPIAIRGEVQDILSRSGKYFIVFKAELSNNDLFLVLETPEAIAAVVSEQDGLYFGTNIVIASITSVETPMFSPHVNANEPNDIFIDLSYSSIHVAKGKCLAISKLNDK